ncbi:nucleoside-diphosphate-sugar epimerase [Salirhabdus euzebyi]|uniref:Nucleoside-diphosphate-sugar epimerase n=1 Tax=Salirhabdus euzebyi TaxID=394506 RepID=A0A841Q1V8_9BACI|nr:NAD(P)H-binding protein [Salirhabdus euzebyi]MBB6452262.1 nucleoside-diphosphate-sugar epimerase [Salirhabdus euzebyi]
MTHGKTALIAGASGLVGNKLLHELLQGQEYKKVYSLVRSPSGIEHAKLTEVVCNFDKLEDVEEYFSVDDVFCCLGTTIKKAKSKEAMYKVDVEYPLAIAELAKKNNVQHFSIISSMNANANSILWYPKMKGILENKLTAISFRSISIMRPSLLLGERKEFRLGEAIASKIFTAISFLLKESWKSRLAINAETVARAMFYLSQIDKQGVGVYTANEIKNMSSLMDKK